MKEQILKPKKEFVQEQLNIEKLTPPLQWDGIMRAMDKYAEHYLEAKTRWIPVSERLPEIREKGYDVLAKNDTDYAALIICSRLDIKVLVEIFTHWKEII